MFICGPSHLPESLSDGIGTFGRPRLSICQVAEVSQGRTLHLSG